MGKNRIDSNSPMGFCLRPYCHLLEGLDEKWVSKFHGPNRAMPNIASIPSVHGTHSWNSHDKFFEFNVREIFGSTAKISGKRLDNIYLTQLVTVCWELMIQNKQWHFSLSRTRFEATYRHFSVLIVTIFSLGLLQCFQF